MGLLKAALGAAGGVLADAWLEYFYCDAIPENVLAVKGKKRISGRSSNTSGENNIISNGSKIAVADGQCMIIVDQGAVVELCAEPGEFIYDTSTSPSIFAGKFGESLVATFKEFWDRFKHGGSPAKDQRVYYINTKEIFGNKYGTANPVPFHIVDKAINLETDVSIKCFGEYSYEVSNPILFYQNVCGNFSDAFTRDRIDSQLKTELLTALQPALYRVSELGIRYSALPGHTAEIADALNTELSEKWVNLRGISVVSFGVSSVTASKEDEDRIKELQTHAALRDPSMAAAHLTGAYASAMENAAQNEGGAFLGFAGLNAASGAGGNAVTGMYQMAAQQQAQQQAQQAAANAWTCSCGTQNVGKFCYECGKPQPAPEGAWTCSCGNVNTGKFCSECGKPKPAPEGEWTCECGAVNTGRFCVSCGKAKPAEGPVCRCAKCGFTPADPANPPKFCPECGAIFGEEDTVKE
ncbi:MAG: SPFH domain-containing protein [Clostridiales bacterium]|nr:SPFH domain-containing protein [Clostridiales bacterium]